MSRSNDREWRLHEQLVDAERERDEARDLLAQAVREWTPTQGPTDEWVRRASALGEAP